MKFEIAPKSTEIQANWYDAKLYCFLLDVNGKTGWRLPSHEELTKIYESANDCEKDWYWSSTETRVLSVPNLYGAWTLDFINGDPFSGNKNFDANFVRAVRDL